MNPSLRRDSQSARTDRVIVRVGGGPVRDSPVLRACVCQVRSESLCVTRMLRRGKTERGAMRTPKTTSVSFTFKPARPCGAVEGFGLASHGCRRAFAVHTQTHTFTHAHTPPYQTHSTIAACRS